MSTSEDTIQAYIWLTFGISLSVQRGSKPRPHSYDSLPMHCSFLKFDVFAVTFVVKLCNCASV